MNGEARTNTDTARTNADMLHEDVTGPVIGAFYRAYDRLGFGFLELPYRNALAIELDKAGLGFEREVPIDIWYDAIQIGHYRADFMVEGRVIVEVKASQAIGDADTKQVMNYLRSTRAEVGLLLHFGPRAGFKRLLYTNDRKRL